MTYALINFPLFHYEDPVTGLPAADWKVYTYKAGTVTPLETYVDKNCIYLNTNPIILNANGNATIYVKENLKIILSEPDNDALTPHLTVDYLNVSQADIVKGTQASMTNNLYAVTSSPAQTAYSDQMILVFTPATDSLTTTTSQAFTGTGQNDAVFFGPYTGSTSGSVFTVEIQANGTPDNFRWKKDGGAWTSSVGITGAEQDLTDGVKVKFARVTGHTIGDIWALTVELPVKIDLDSLGSKMVYENINGTMTAVGAGIRAGYPCQFIYSSTVGAWVWINPAAPALTADAPTRVRKEVTTAYTIIDDDAGDQVAMLGDGAFTLPASADFANQFVYLQCVGGVATITADGTEKIYKPFDSVGATTFAVGGSSGYDTVQLQSDSVGWHVMTAIGKNHMVLTGTGSFEVPAGVTFLLATGVAAGGVGENPGNGGAAGESKNRWVISVTPLDILDYSVGAGTASDGDDTTLDIHGGANLLTLAGGVTGAGVGVDGDDSDFGAGGISATQTDPTPNGGGGGYGDNDFSWGADGFLMLEW